MLKSFSRYLKEERNKCYATFNTAVAPSAAHGRMFDAVKALADGKEATHYVVESVNVKSYRKSFGTHARKIVTLPGLTGLEECLSNVSSMGRSSLVLVVGNNLVESTQEQLSQIEHDLLSVEVVGFGDIDPNTGSSETMMESATNNDYHTFSQLASNNLSDSDTKKMFNEARIVSGLDTQHEFKSNVKLQPVSKEREAFVEGTLFYVGESVVIKSTNKLGSINRIGTNYLVVESDGKLSRHWIDAVESLQEHITQEGDGTWSVYENTGGARVQGGFKSRDLASDFWNRRKASSTDGKKSTLDNVKANQ
jgi:hypothetical protein